MHGQIPPYQNIAVEHLLCAFAASHVAWHIYNNKPWHGGPCLCYILNGIANLAPSSSKKPPHPPITHSMLLLLANSLSITDSFNACFAMSHLLPPFNQNGSCKCHLPFTKAKHCGEDVCICWQLGPSDPIATINNHLNINKIPPNLPLFSYLST
ncbi:hypothetical protein BS17DRAFT_835965 [Gyrodon lividus]|nr:hypothetical protein BS17DRAFT_835965 [Gyrodon lividus]